MAKTRVINGEEMYVMGVQKIWVEVEAMYMRKTVYATKDYSKRYAMHCGRVFEAHKHECCGMLAISGEAQTEKDNAQEVVENKEAKKMAKIVSKVYARKGAKYQNNNGTTYTCTGTRFDERGEHVATMKSPAGWVCDVYGLALLDNGTFEWAYSKNGHFE